MAKKPSPAATPAPRAMLRRKLTSSALAGVVTTLAAAPTAKPVVEKKKPAPKKADTSAAAKPAKAEKTAKPVPVEFTPRVLPKGKTLHVVDLTERPSRNPALAAHTMAALTVLGMFSEKAPAVPEATLLTLLGSAAVRHHVKENSMMRADDGCIRLTPAGMGHFRARTYNKALANAFVELMIDGKVAAPLTELGITQSVPVAAE